MNGLLTLLSESLDCRCWGITRRMPWWGWLLIAITGWLLLATMAIMLFRAMAIAGKEEDRAPAPLADEARVGSLRKSPSERSPALSRSPRGGAWGPIEERSRASRSSVSRPR